jgi:hypothetical protein
MSDSLRVFTTEYREVDADLLARRTGEVVRRLLGQHQSFRIDLEFQVDGQRCQALIPNGVIGSFVEKVQVGAGVFFTYGLDADWELESPVPRYEFCVTEIPRRRNDALLLVCGALAIAFAQCVSATAIVDFNGVWGTQDVVPISDVLALGLQDPWPLETALNDFYARLPAFRAG